jgi:phosphohistidine swiveling domain-containing protein
MTDFVVSLDYPGARLPSIAGGKGASLAKMRGMGLPVPSGFVVTAEAFRRCNFPLPEDMELVLSEKDPTHLDVLEPLCQAARQAILSQEIPEEVASAVGTAYAQMGEGVAVSVRSSATAEDRAWASFAGQYDTFLNVVGPNDLLRYLSQVWASLYSTRAVAYRMRLGVPHRSVSMAVVVQRQLQPQAAGVLFTRDPVTGYEGHYQVNAALGLGEGVVAGLALSDTFTVDSATGEVVSQVLSRKDSMIALAPGGGVAPSPVPNEHQNAPALTQEELSRLGSLAHQVTQLFQADQDIEFAVQDGDVWLLQSRPITAMSDPPPFPVVWEEPGDAEFTWTRDRFAGPGPMFKLQEDATGFYAEGERVCFQETGAPMASNHILRMFNGFAYSRAPVGADAEASERQKEHADRDRAYQKRGTSLYEAEIGPQVEQTLAELRRFRPRRASIAALVEHLESAMQAYGHVMGGLHWSMAAGTHMDWPSTYREITGEPEVASGTLLQSIPNKTTQLVRRLRNLGRLVQQGPDLTRIFQERAYHQLWEGPLSTQAAVQHFRTRLQGLLRTYGTRTGRGFGSSVYFTASTWNMDPQQPLEIIASYAQQDLDALERLEIKAKRSRRQAERRVRRMLSNDPELLRRFNRNLAVAVDRVKQMENHNHIMEQGVNGALREAIHWTGLGLVREGLLDNPDDVLHLALAELRELAESGGLGNLRELAQEREEEIKKRSNLRPPAALGKARPPRTLAANPRSMYDVPPDAGLDGHLLRGTGASPGKASGRARVVPVNVTLPHVEKGDILVAQNAGPAWTPILPLLGGLVLDQGAVFQHAALVAREYGIPAVVMTRDATRVIVEGQAITVDADQGIVDLMPAL